MASISSCSRRAAREASMRSSHPTLSVLVSRAAATCAACNRRSELGRVDGMMHGTNALLLLGCSRMIWRFTVLL